MSGGERSGEEGESFESWKEGFGTEVARGWGASENKVRERERRRERGEGASELTGTWEDILLVLLRRGR